MPITETELLECIEESAHVGAWWLRLSDSHLFWTAKTYAIHEAEPDYQPNLETALEFYLDEYRESLLTLVDRAIKFGHPYEFIAKIKTGKGNLRWIKTCGSYKEQDGETFLLGAFWDITREITLRNQLELSDGEHQAVLDSMLEALITIDQSGLIIDFNLSAEKMFGYKASDMAGQPVQRLMPEPDRSRHSSYIENYQKTGQTKIIGVGRELTAQKSDGTLFPIHLSIAPIKTTSGGTFIGTVRDLSAEKIIAERIEYLTYYDELTGFPNRASLLNFLKNISDQYFYSVVAINIDGLSKVNAAYDNNEGDQLILAVSKIISSYKNEDLYYSRDISDRFLIITKEHKQYSHKNADRYIGYLKSVLKSPIQGTAADHYVSLSIGVSFSKPKDTAYHKCVYNAESSLFAAKSQGKGLVNYFRQQQNLDIANEYRLEVALREGLKNNQFEFWIQPKADMDDRFVSGEALIRWMINNKPFSSPEIYIAIAEQSNLIEEIGNLTIEFAATALKQINSTAPNFSLAINVSPKQFLTESFPDNIKRIFKENDARTSNLIIEITEGLLIHEIESVINTLKDLSYIGVKVSIDDFGTGHSNLKRILDLNIKELKLDRSIIFDVDISTKSQTLVRALCQMAIGLEIDIVAEGVETKAVSDWCKQNGITYLQGYFYSKPLPFSDFLKLIN